MIVDGQGHVVWFHQLQLPEVAGNLRIQHYAGKPVLTWWQGPVTVAAYGLGEGVIADTRYRTLHVVHAGNGYAMDIHEFSLTPEGDALFTVYSPVLVHLPGTPPGTLTSLIDAIVQEVDVRTGLVTWEWHALGHIPLRDSYATPANSAFYDAFHINSIQPLAHGRVLISSRDASAVYELDRATGHILWTLGGKASDFRIGRGARFWFQHDAALRSGDRVSLFDDGAGPPQREPASRGTDPRARPAPPRRAHGPPVPALERHLGAERGQLADAPGRRRLRRLRCHAVLLPVHQRREARVRRQPARRRRKLPRLQLPLEHDADHEAGGRGASTRPRSRSTRAGTAPPRSPAGRCWPAPAPGRCSRWARRRGVPTSRPGSTCPAPRRRSRCGRWTGGATCSLPRRWRPPPSRRRTRQRGR